MHLLFSEYQKHFIYPLVSTGKYLNLKNFKLKKRRRFNLHHSPTVKKRFTAPHNLKTLFKVRHNNGWDLVVTCIQLIAIKELIICPMCSCGLFIPSSAAFDEHRHVGQLSVCVYVCVCLSAFSGSVVSSDKRQAGSTSLQEEGKTQQWGTGGKGGWRDSRGWWVKCWKIHEWERGQLWRSRSRFRSSHLASPCQDADTWYVQLVAANQLLNQSC